MKHCIHDTIVNAMSKLFCYLVLMMKHCIHDTIVNARCLNFFAIWCYTVSKRFFIFIAFISAWKIGHNDETLHSRYNRVLSVPCPSIFCWLGCVRIYLCCTAWCSSGCNAHYSVPEHWGLTVQSKVNTAFSSVRFFSMQCSFEHFSYWECPADSFPHLLKVLI